MNIWFYASAFGIGFNGYWIVQNLIQNDFGYHSLWSIAGVIGLGLVCVHSKKHNKKTLVQRGNENV